MPAKESFVKIIGGPYSTEERKALEEEWSRVNQYVYVSGSYLKVPESEIRPYHKTRGELEITDISKLLVDGKLPDDVAVKIECPHSVWFNFGGQNPEWCMEFTKLPHLTIEAGGDVRFRNAVLGGDIGLNIEKKNLTNLLPENIVGNKTVNIKAGERVVFGHSYLPRIKSVETKTMTITGMPNDIGEVKFGCLDVKQCCYIGGFWFGQDDDSFVTIALGNSNKYSSWDFYDTNAIVKKADTLEDIYKAAALQRRAKASQTGKLNIFEAENIDAFSSQVTIEYEKVHLGKYGDIWSRSSIIKAGIQELRANKLNIQMGGELHSGNITCNEMEIAYGSASINSILPSGELGEINVNGVIDYDYGSVIKAKKISAVAVSETDTCPYRYIRNSPSQLPAVTRLAAADGDTHERR
ncbi:MAG: hypothetical protein FWE53_00775 [Firmicutes bacterium]|nr:hypothetical protein [Bacillota bacterium]